MIPVSKFLDKLPSVDASRRRFSWKYAARHFDDLGSVRVSLYVFFRHLIPGCLLAGWWFANHPTVLKGLPNLPLKPEFSLYEIGVLVLISICWQLSASGDMAIGKNLIRKQAIANVMGSFSCTAVLAIFCYLHSPGESAVVLCAGFLAGTLVLSSALLGFACVLRWAILMFVVDKREVIIVGSGAKAEKLLEEMRESPMHQVVGIVDDEFVGTPAMKKLYLGKIERLNDLLKIHPVQVAYCTLPMKSMYGDAQRAITICENIGVEVLHSTHLFDTRFAHLDAFASAFGMFAILRMVRMSSTRYIKRLIDIAGAAALLLLSAPILIVTAIVVKMDDGGSIFFAQERYGLNRKRFKMYKFRTMVPNAEALQVKYESMNEVDGPVFKIKNDPRITSIGGFLRKTSIDELPQLWNVLRGDMSLVGPRPLSVRDVLKIDDSNHLRRFSVKPGITCLWQMSGRNNTDFATWIRQDLDYIDRWSLMLDARILIGTIPAVLLGRGAM